MKLLYRLTMVILSALLCGIVFTGCEEDKYNKIDDLFKPRFVLEEPKVEGNSVTLVWYEVNDAVSYTVELHQDNYFSSLFMSIETTNPYVFIEDIPYGTTFNIRVRCNANNSANNSQWSTTSATTEPRPEYAKLLEDVSKTEITENSAIIRWKVDAQNPVDSISVMPMMDKTLSSAYRYLTENEKTQGYAEIVGLDKNTLYAVNIYDTSKPHKYDKPYNQVTFRTAGPSAGSIQVGWDDDLTEILKANDANPEIPEGTEYFLPAGAQYTLTPFSIKKGFRLVGSTEGAKPVVIMSTWWDIASGAYISNWNFENIEFRQELINQYFINASQSFTIENVSFVNCDFIKFGRGFWRHKDANAKYVMNLEMEGCRFDQCGWQGGVYGTFALGSGEGYDRMDRAVFRNCTFSRDDDGTGQYAGWGNLFYAPSMNKPIHLEYKNVTVYYFCRNSRMINIESAVGSELIIEGMVLASPCGNIYVAGANTTTSFSNNYTTKEYVLGGKDLKATELDITATDLFAAPEDGDLTIKDATSPIVTNRAGDTRWIP